jgi:hypothetical protein
VPRHDRRTSCRILDPNQCRHNPVLIRRPYLAVAPQETGASTFFAAKAQRSIEQASGEPLETHWHLEQLAPESCYDAVDHAAADHRFSDCCIALPLRTMLEQVIDHHRQIVVRRQQASRWRHDAMAIMVGIAGKGDVVTLLQANQALHGIRR